MTPVARNVTDAEDGFLKGQRYLLHDRDGKFCPSFREILRSAGVEPIALPPRSSNLNAVAELWVRSVQEECLGKLILFVESTLRRAHAQYESHFVAERNHQELSNQIPFAVSAERIGTLEGPVRCRMRLGGLLRFYHRGAG